MASMKPGSYIKILCDREEKNVSVVEFLIYLVKLKLKKKTHAETINSKKKPIFNPSKTILNFPHIFVRLTSPRKHYVFLFLKLNQQCNIITLKYLCHYYIENLCFCYVELQRNSRELPIPIIILFNL